MRVVSLLLTSCAVVGCGRFGFSQNVTGDASDGGGDGRSDDGAVARANLGFVTAGVYTGAFGSVSAADAICEAEAAAADRSGDFVALLWSSDRPDPSAQLAGSSGWVRADGLWLADSPEQLVQGTLAAPLVLTASGDNKLEVSDGGEANRVWNGQIEGDCSNWSSTATMGDQTWFKQWARISDGMWPCSDLLRLACFERGHQATRPSSPTSAKRVFLSSIDIASGGGVAAADALCNSDASVHGIGPSTAILGTSTSAGIDRVPNGRTTRYQRVDGIEVGLLTDPQVWINVDAAGASRTASMWTGGAVDTIPTATCSNWTSTSGSVEVGLSWELGAPFESGVSAPCSGLAAVVCAER